jgi:methyltransferase (TIGR00027 family)
MKANTASRTAQYMALFRALETKRSSNKKLFNDPYAINFLDKTFKTVCNISSLPFAYNIISKIIQRKIPGALSSGVARTKYIDDLLQYTIDIGSRRVIILGAGFDTRALRLDFLKNISVIEIDHPDTATLKVNILKKMLDYLPPNVSYLQIDFNTQNLNDLLSKDNIDFDIPTTIIWEGVTNYLTKDAVDKTFSLLKKFTKDSYIIFTYVDKLVLSKPELFFEAEKLLNNLNKIEESWTFGFNPAELSDYLKQFDFKLLEDSGARDYRERYMPERKNISKGYEFYRVAFAQKPNY